MKKVIYEVEVRSYHEKYASEYILEMQQKGWEIAGPISVITCHQGNRWAELAFKRPIKTQQPQ